MASLYTAGVNGLDNQSLNWTSGTIKAALVQTGYIFNPNHSTMTPIAAFELSGGDYARVALTSLTETSSSTLNGTIFSSALLTFANLQAAAIGVGNSIVGMVLYQDFGSGDSTNIPIAFIDYGSPPTAFPTPTGGAYILAPSALTGWFVHQAASGNVGMQYSEFNGNGSTTVFTLTFVPSFPSALIVAVGGTLKRPTNDFSYSATTNAVTFVSAPGSGTNNVQVWGV